MKRSLVILISAAAGLAAGFAVRWIQHGAPETAGPKKPSLIPSFPDKADGAKAGAPRQARRLTPLAAHLEEELTVSSGVSRWLEWMSALESAQPGDFPDLARVAAGNPVALRMVSARWLELDRDHLLDTIIGESSKAGPPGGGGAFPFSELGQYLFETWSKTDPAGAIAALSRPDFPVQLKDLRYTAINAVMNDDPELGLKTMAAWHIENYGVSASGIAKWAAADPRHAAEFALAHPAGGTTQSAMKLIGKEWAKTDPAAAMAFAAGVKNSYGPSLAEGVLRAWTASGVDKAAAWLAAADPSVRNRFSGAMVEIWAKTDTAAAMNWIQENLSGTGLDEAVGSVLKGAAEISVPNAAALVNEMNASAARAKAAVSVARKWWPEYQVRKPAPAEAVAWLSSLDPGSIKHVVEQMHWQWSGSDPKGFFEFLTTSAGQHAPEYAFMTAARQMAQNSPEEAIAWASRLPEGQRDAAAQAAFLSWQSGQPQAALNWLRQLPAEDPRRESWHTVLVGEYVPDREAASSIAKTLASGNNAAVQKAVQALAIPEDHKVKLLDRLLIR